MVDMARKLVGFTAVPLKDGGYRMLAAFDDGLIVAREDQEFMWTPVKTDLKAFVNGQWLG
jgi:hypothetical protein